MLVVSVARNGQIQQHSGQRHAEAVLPGTLSRATIRAVERGEKRLHYLWKEFMAHDPDGCEIGKRRDRVGPITVLDVDFADVCDLGLDVARGCGYKTVQSLRDEWDLRHPRSPRAAVVWFALGDWRDRDVFMNWTGRAGGDYCVDEETEALTKRGWLRYDEIRDDDELLGYDIASHQTRWERHTGVHVFPAKKRELVEIKHRSGSILSTPNHRWPVVIKRRKSVVAKECPYCGDTLNSMGYPIHVKTCERNRQIAQRLVAGESHSTLATTFGVSAVTVDRIGRGVRSRPRIARLPDDRSLIHSRDGSFARIREERTTATLGFAVLMNGAPCGTLPVEPTYSDAFVELVAWFCTEGSQKRDRKGALRKTLGISQSFAANPENVRDIVRVLDETCPGHWKYGAGPNRREEMKNFLLDQVAARPVLEVAPNKVMTPEFVLALARDQLELLWYTWMRGDGSWSESLGCYGPGIGQKDRARLEPLQMVVSLLGDGSILRYRPPVKHSYDDRFGFGEWSLIRSKRHIFDQRTHPHVRIVHEGIVWCPSTPSTYWLARRGGRTFLTGNTMNARRAMDSDAPVLTREEIEALSAVNRQKDDGRRARAAAELASETPSQRLARLGRATERMGDDARRAIRQELRVIEQRVRRAEGRK